MKRALSLLLLAAAGCSLGTEPDRVVADVLGTWQYSGVQTAPSLSLSGSMAVSRQVRGEIEGSASWIEDDGIGVPQLRVGQVFGTVVGLTDIDFEISLADVSRRHVARISANGDTLEGVWSQGSGGLSGSFVAVRQP